MACAEARTEPSSGYFEPFWRRLTTLRSNQTISMVATRQIVNEATTMTSDRITSPKSTPSLRNG